ncbi:MAG: UvrD-helicase domain-containing protein [Clostridia bacterium]|nr:UvrD-helicase domain-containing protein [Clostridia bacterium]
MIKLNEAQAKAMIPDGHILVLAGAGSGKTRVLTQRIALLVNEYGVNPRNILAITFTNKASGEMKERLAQVTNCADKMWISTIHSMCAKILRFEAEHLGYTSSFSIYSDTDSEKLIKRIVAEMKTGDEDENIAKNAMWHISRAKNAAMSPERYRNEYGYERNIDKITEIYKKYEVMLKRANSMDFDDLLLNVLKLFKTNKPVLDKYSDRFRYISVDEFQDTNTVQYEILKLLQSKHQNLFVVGDDDQSIYGWRGAEIKNILNFDKDFPDAKIFKLEQNYRSTKKILGVANEIISKNTNRHDKQLWTENGDGVRIETYCGYNESEEAYYVVSQIESLVRYCNMQYSDFAILMRMNALSRSFEQECTKFGIPAKVFGGFKFFERKEIKDLVAYLKVVTNIYDDESLLRIINVPKRGIGDTTIKKLAQIADQNAMPILQLLTNEELMSAFNKGTRTKLLGFAQLINELYLYQKDHEVKEFVNYVINKTAYRDSLADKEAEIDRIRNLDEFMNSVEEFVKQNPGCTVRDYVESVTLVADRDVDDDSNYVTLATVHAAKGLEFKVVFVVGLEDGIFPNGRAKFDVVEMEEERRLMYVAVTRAKERLYLTHARNRYMYGQSKPTIPSEFFSDVDDFVKPKESVVSKPVFSTGLTCNEKNKNISRFEKGQKVKHKVFGEGVIILIKGENADVAFKGVGIKTLSLKFAPLEVIG